ncbi:serine/threonine protein kinase [Actinomadura monticuli]|uniref:Serine/threonine-protein kinase n=1 Tax=Actinomadura monticuli TaxID=3097367 RepID=A0ABV4Q9R7_9ACTN
MPQPLHEDDPQRLGPYRILSRLGRGGMGTVYLAQDEQNQQVAIKVINPAVASDPVFHQRFRREVEAARRVRPFSTAPVLDASLDRPPLYVVTEYIPGPTLTEAVADTGPLTASDLAGLAVGVATALAAIHAAGIVHRDLKPSNVLLSGVGPRVIDFGIAKAQTQTGVTYGEVVGTPAYQAPEVMAGRPITPASDVFAWGGLVVFAGTGRDPFQGTSLSEVLYRVANDSPNLDGLDPNLRGLVSKALDKDPAKRPSIPEILHNLTGRIDPAIGHSPSTPPPQPSFQKPRPATAPLPKLRLTLAACILLILVGAGFTIVSKFGRDHGEATQTGTAPGTNNTTPSPQTPTQPQQPPATTSALPTERPRESPGDPGDVPPRFLGQWTGTVTHDATIQRTYSALITITGGKKTQEIGQSEYSSMGCRGTLRLVSVTQTRLVVEEHIDKGDCKDVVLITLTYRRPRSLLYEYKLSSSTSGEGELSPA